MATWQCHITWNTELDKKGDIHEYWSDYPEHLNNVFEHCIVNRESVVVCYVWNLDTNTSHVLTTDANRPTEDDTHHNLYEVNISSMVQTNLRTGCVRKIRRVCASED